MTKLERRIVSEALEWVGTPFVWGQSVKQVGCDCKGLLQGVMREVGRAEADSIYANFTGYRVDRPVPGNVLLEGFSALFDRADEIKPGRILLMKLGNGPSHMAIASSETRAVHAFPGRKAEVCERDLSVLFHKFPLHSIWSVRRAH